MTRNVNSECKPITNVDAKILRDLNRAQKIILSKREWTWAHVQGVTLTTIADTEVYALSPLIDLSKVIYIRDPNTQYTLEPMTEAMFRRQYPNQNSSNGNPIIFRYVGESPVQFQPAAASLLTFVSDSAADVTQTISVQGLNDSGIMVTEVITLDGVNPQITTALFTRVISLSKSAYTTGSVTVTSDAGATTNVVIGPGERAISHPLFAFYPIPAAAISLEYDFYLKAQNLTVGTDIPVIPEKYHDALELYAIARLFSMLNRRELAVSALQEFEARVSDMENDDGQPRGIWSKNSSTFNDTNEYTRERLILGI